MSTFVLIEPDAFQQGFAQVGKNRRPMDNDPLGIDRSDPRFHQVRRPVRGIQIKNDTYATLQVRNAKGEPLYLFDAASDRDTEGGKGTVNSNFLLQQVSESRVEKQQVVLTFGEPYIFFFGEQPRILSVSGALLNTEDFNWRAEWWENYDKYLRGTACVRSRTRVYLSWDDIIVEGYVISATAQETSQEPYFVQFQFQMFLTNYQNISNIGGIDAHWAGKAIDLDPNEDLPDTGGQISSTRAVRQANQGVFIGGVPGVGANSLLSSLRRGIDTIMNIDGQIVNTLDFVGRFLSGRNIRVPIGYEGSAAFDVDVQIALASVGPPQGLDRVVSLRAPVGKLIEGFRASLGAKFLAYDKEQGYGPGLPLSANDDEFVARIANDPSELAFEAIPFFEDQQTRAIDLGNRVAGVFRAYGIDVEPSSELNLMFKKIMFGIASIGLGMNLSKVSAGIRQAVNVTGAIL